MRVDGSCPFNEGFCMIGHLAHTCTIVLIYLAQLGACPSTTKIPTTLLAAASWPMCHRNKCTLYPLVSEAMSKKVLLWRTQQNWRESTKQNSALPVAVDPPTKTVALATKVLLRM